MKLSFKSLILSAAATLTVMLSACTDTTVDKVVSLNNQYAESFDRTTSQEEFIEQQTAYSEAIGSLTKELNTRSLSTAQLNAVERSAARVDSSMNAAATRVGLIVE